MYLAQGWCDASTRSATTGNSWTLGDDYNNPEFNCCACGKEMADVGVATTWATCQAPGYAFSSVWVDESHGMITTMSECTAAAAATGRGSPAVGGGEWHAGCILSAPSWGG